MKKCKSCQKEIDQKATKCPYCQSDQRNWFRRHPILTIIIVLFIIGLIGSSGDSKKTSDIKTTVTPTQAQVDSNETSQNSTLTTPTNIVAKPTDKVEPTSNVTVSQKNALKKAQSYLSFSAFSHDGLVAQLEYEQFSHADAVYGADNVGADWNEQAAKKAESYMKSSAFSRGSLIEQLKYDKFTQAQAEYGANAVGL